MKKVYCISSFTYIYEVVNKIINPTAGNGRCLITLYGVNNNAKYKIQKNDNFILIWS